MLSEAKHPAISIKLGSWFGYETDSSSGHAKLNSKLAEVARSFAHAQDDSVPGLMGYADTAGA